MKYKILQCKSNTPYLFRSYDEAKENGFKVADYEIVYEGELAEDLFDADSSEIDYLEYLFEKFNLSRPADFYGHSLSTSDLIDLEGSIYYCDSMGWEKVN